jgi:cytidyltransferase-like protein
LTFRSPAFLTNRKVKTVVVSGGFDDFGSRHVRFLEEAAGLGPVRVLIHPDETVALLAGRPPSFPEMERLYLVRSMRFVDRAEIGPPMKSAHVLPDVGPPKNVAWAVLPEDDAPEKRAFSTGVGLTYVPIPEADLAGFPVPTDDLAAPTARKKVIVSGCYDHFHSGHVRFFEEAATYGELTVSVGRDETLRELKGSGHPKFRQEERLYMVRAVRHVARAVFGTGGGWMDAAPEIEVLKPDFYVVNEDGDRPEKRAFCCDRGIVYVVLKREPKEGLPRRDSSTLRGF